MSSSQSHAASRKHNNDSVEHVDPSNVERPVASESVSQCEPSNHSDDEQEVPLAIDESLFLQNITLFYLKLQAKLLLPATTIHTIIEGYQDVHDISLTNLLRNLSEKLTVLGIPEATISNIMDEISQLDLQIIHGKRSGAFTTVKEITGVMNRGQGLSSPHNEAVTSHLVAALTASPDMDGVDRGVLLLACKTYYETVRRNFRYSQPDLADQAAAIKNSARSRQRTKRLLEARRSVLATTEEVDFWRGITIDMMSDEEDHSIDREVGWIVRPPSFRSHKLSDLRGRLQERLEMNPKYVATHHKRLHIGSPSDRLALTQYDSDPAKRHLMRPEA
ncbi:hypothetical protein ABVT39_000612 [Epinephelus coioides]